MLPTFFLYDFLRIKVGAFSEKKSTLPKKNKEVREIVQLITHTKEVTLNKFLQSTGWRIIVSGKMRVTGLDPMNITHLGKRAIHHRFIKVQVDNKDWFIFHPVLTSFDEHFRQLYQIELSMEEKPIIENGIIIIGDYKCRLKSIEDKRILLEV